MDSRSPIVVGDRFRGNDGQQAGATLLEIVVAMLIIGAVATGVMTAFMFGRQVTLRSHTELAASRLAEEIAETLRSAVDGPIPAGRPFEGLTLEPGIYVDQNMAEATTPEGATPLAALDLPADFVRFQDPASGTGTGIIPNEHGDGRLVVVEDAPVDADDPPDGIQADELALVDLDGDGFAGVDLDGDRRTDLRRVRVRVEFTSPSA